MTVAALCVTTGGIWALKNQKEFQTAAKTFRDAMHEFLNEHMVEPIQYVAYASCKSHSGCGDD